MATRDLFDIAGGTNGAWTAAILYGGSSTLFTTGTTATPDPYTGGGQTTFINPNGGQRYLRFDVKNRVLSPAFYLRHPGPQFGCPVAQQVSLIPSRTTLLQWAAARMSAHSLCRWRTVSSTGANFPNGRLFSRGRVYRKNGSARESDGGLAGRASGIDGFPVHSAVCNMPTRPLTKCAGRNSSARAGGCGEW